MGNRRRPWPSPVTASAPDPDLTVTHAAHADDYFRALPSELVLFVLEVVSTTRPSIRRDYDEKPEIYALGGIPVYLLVDPGGWLLAAAQRAGQRSWPVPDRAQGCPRRGRGGA